MEQQTRGKWLIHGAKQHQGPVSICDKTSYREISQSLLATRLAI